jgi:TolB-like protein
MSPSQPQSALGRVFHTAREFLTHWVIGGVFILATGFAPEHWFAHLAEHLHLPERVIHLWPNVLDIRAVLVFAGVAIIAGDFVLRRRTPKQSSMPAPVAAESTAGPPLPDKPSIAILPFANMSDDKDQEYLADGIVEDTLTALSQVSSLFVVARNSSFAFKGKNADVRDVGRQLGVRYVLEGSVRRAGDRLRVTAQLIDATDGAHLWAERYERQVQDISRSRMN